MAQFLSSGPRQISRPCRYHSNTEIQTVRNAKTAMMATGPPAIVMMANAPKPTDSANKTSCA